MKYNYKKSLLAIAISISLVGLGTGCSKIDDFGSTNTRGDASSVPLTSGLITSAESQIGSSIMTGLTAGLRAELYAQHFAEEQYTDQSTYATPQLDFGGTYAGALMDLQKVINLNTDAATKNSAAVLASGSNGNQLGVAKILKAYWIWTLTDRWGDVPNTEALKGAADLNPAYDKQEDIYNWLFATLKEANNSFDGGAIAKGDILYNYANNNPATAVWSLRWKKLANSLRMLIALRLSEKYPNAGQLAATEFALAANDANGFITANSESLIAQYSGASSIESNVWYNTLNGRKDYDLSLTLADILTNMGDPRKAAFGTSGAPMPYGLTRDQAVAYTGANSGNISRPFATKLATSPIYIVPASYVLLAAAEGVERGWWAGANTAKGYYDLGVTASFAQWGAGSATTYLASAADYNTGVGGGNNVGYLAAYPSVQGNDARTTTKLQRIALQKYIATFGDGIQAWAEWRRSGFPILVPTQYGTNSPKVIPLRFTYGVNEYATNAASVAAAATRYTGGDVPQAKMWWDQ